MYWSYGDRTNISDSSDNGVFCQIGFNELVFTTSLSN